MKSAGEWLKKAIGSNYDAVLDKLGREMFGAAYLEQIFENEEYANAKFLTCVYPDSTKDSNKFTIVGILVYIIQDDTCKLIVITSDARTKGVGTNLWKYLLKQCAKSQNVNTLTLNSLGYPSTRMFYFRKGMRDISDVYDKYMDTQVKTGDIDANELLKADQDNDYQGKKGTFRFIDDAWHLLGKKQDNNYNKSVLQEVCDKIVQYGEKEKWLTWLTKGDLVVPNALHLDEEKIKKASEWFDPRWNYIMTMKIDSTASGAGAGGAGAGGAGAGGARAGAGTGVGGTRSGAGVVELDEAFMRLLCLTGAPTRVTVDAAELRKKLFLA